MGKKNPREKQKRAQAKKARKAAARKKAAGKRPSTPRLSGAMDWTAPFIPDLPLPALSPPRPERLAPAVYVDASGQIVPDPRAVLGLGPGPLDEPTVRQAWLAATRAAPPERDPEGARRAREARDRLILPDRWREREFGVLQAPDGAAWGLPDAPPGPSEPRLDAVGRLAAATVLYALVEDALEAG